MLSRKSYESNWNKSSFTLNQKKLIENVSIKKAEFIKHPLPFYLPKKMI